MDKRKEIMLESVLKLISAGASDDEILESLLDVGTSREDGLEIIAEARKAKPGMKEAGQAKTGTLDDKIKIPSDIKIPKKELPEFSPLSIDVGKDADADYQDKGKGDLTDKSAEFWKTKQKKAGIGIPFIGQKKGKSMEIKKSETFKDAGKIQEKKPFFNSVFGFLGKKQKVREIIVRSPLEDKLVPKGPSRKTAPARGSKFDAADLLNEAPKPETSAKKTVVQETQREPDVHFKKSDETSGAGKESDSLSELEKLMNPTMVNAKGKKAVQKKQEPEEILKSIEAAIPETKFKTERDKHLLVIIPNKEYLKSIIILSKALSIQYKKVCYVSMNELHESLIKNLKEAGINTNNFFFVDAITRTSQSKIQKVPNAIFISSPNSLVELSLAISDVLNKQNPDVVLFDSISTLLIYERGATSTKFLHSLIGKIKSSRSAAVFTALEGDANADAVRDLGMFVDEVLTMSEYQLYKMRIGPYELPLLPEMRNQKSGLISALKDFEMVNVRPKEIAETRKNVEPELVKGEIRELQEKMASLSDVKQPAISKFLKKIEQLESKSVSERAIPDILGELREMKSEISKSAKPEVDYGAPVRKALEEIVEKINLLSVPKGDKNSEKINAELRNLSNKIGEMERKPMQIKDQKLMEMQLKSLEKKISKLEKGPEIKKYIKSAVAEIKKQKPRPMPKIGMKKLENKLARIEKRLRQEESSKKKDEKRQRKLESRKAKLEEERREASLQVAGLEKKMRLLNESYALGMISKSAYDKDKAGIEQLLRKGH